MMEFTQAQAAKLSLLDERNFRVLADEGSVLPTAETKNFGRGKAKRYSREEVRIASVVASLNLRAASLRPKVGAWLRKGGLEKPSRAVTEDKPIYIIVEDGKTTGHSALWWQPAFDGLEPIGTVPFLSKKSKDRLISVMVDDEGARRPLKSFVATNLADALWWDRLTEAELAKWLDPQEELNRILESLRR